MSILCNFQSSLQDHKSSPENEVNDADSQASGDGIAHEAYDRPQHGTDGEHLVSKNKAKALVSVENIYQDVALTFNPPTLGEEHTMPAFDDAWTWDQSFDASLIEATDWLRSSSCSADLDPSFLLPASSFGLRHSHGNIKIGDMATPTMPTPESLFDQDKARFEKALETHVTNLGSGKLTSEDCLATSKAAMCIPIPSSDLTNDALGHFDPKVIDGTLSSSQRDEIIIAMSEGSTSSQALSTVRAFPPVEALDKLIRVFLTREKNLDLDFVHLPTFDISGCSLYLLISCIVAGASSSPTRSVRKFGLGLYDISRYHMLRMAEHDNRLYRDISYIQSLSILSEVGLWSGDQRISEQSDISSQIVASALRNWGCFSQDAYVDYATDMSSTAHDLDKAWREWAKQESLKRTTFKQLIQCTQRSVVRKIPPQISPFEVHTPLPGDAQSWSANSAIAWKNLYARHQSTSPKKTMNLLDAFAKIPALEIPSPPYNIKAVDLCLLYTFLSMLVEDYRQVHAFQGRRDFGWSFNDYSQVPMLNRQVSLYSELRHSINADPYRSSSAVVAFMFDFNILFSSTPLHLSDTLLNYTKRHSSTEIFLQLREWQQTRSSRRAIWHAGQVIRACRMISAAERTSFHVFGMYQALLCLWIYWTTTKLRRASSTTFRNTKTHQILLDGPETIESQQWINHNAGNPFLRRSYQAESSGIALNLFAIDATNQQEPRLALFDVLTDCFDEQVIGRYMPILQSAQMVLQALERV
ncbi:hypothetical protein BM1_05172 [Bipolaris maydis]|nr:hypothetical protein BM1_05172 [Bipolaris maydis]